MISREYSVTDKFALFEANSLQNGRDKFSEWNEGLRAGSECREVDPCFARAADANRGAVWVRHGPTGPRSSLLGIDDQAILLNLIVEPKEYTGSAFPLFL